LVAKEIEIPVEVAKFSIKETGCKNSFGINVPCFQEGEARKRRSAEDAEEKAAAPLITYSGYPYLGLPYAAAGYHPYAAAGYYPYAALPAVKVAEPVVTEVEVPTYTYKAVEKKIELAPLCNNGLGFPVPCA